MSKRKHTPGPWVCLPAHIDRAYEIATWENGSLIAWVPDTRLNSKENAILISQAPNLLNQLKKAIRFFDENGGDKDYSFLPDMKKAVLKAEGEPK